MRGYEAAGEATPQLEEALQAVSGADAAILTLGGRYSFGPIATMGEGVDGADINLPPCQERFLRLASQTDTPLIGVHFDGRPISSDAADESLSAPPGGLGAGCMRGAGPCGCPARQGESGRQASRHSGTQRRSAPDPV